MGQTDKVINIELRHHLIQRVSALGNVNQPDYIAVIRKISVIVFFRLALKQMGIAVFPVFIVAPAACIKQRLILGNGTLLKRAVGFHTL